MEPESTKRPRIEVDIINYVSLERSLSPDMIKYLLEKCNLYTFNSMYSITSQMKRFYSKNWLWRERFKKRIGRLDWGEDHHPLSMITNEEWVRQWDRHAERCKPYRLMISFETFFKSRQQKVGGKVYSVPMAKDKGGMTLDLEFRVEDPFILSRLRVGTLKGFDEDNDMHLLNRLIRIMKLRSEDYTPYMMNPDQLEALDFYGDRIQHGYFYVEQHHHANPYGFVECIYKCLKLRFEPVYFSLKHLDANCAHCAFPNPKGICGSCDQASYCNQKCADAHWEEHNCKSK